MTKAKIDMNWQRTRADLINFRSENARNPVYFHRTSTAVSQIEHLQNPASPRHERRLRKGLALTTREIAKAREDGGRYLPSHHRSRPHSKRR